MVRLTAPAFSNLAPDLIKSYSPPEDKVNVWHTVKNGHTESLLSIATQYAVSVQKLIEFNFPGSVKDGAVVPDIVNWYLFNHVRFRCRDTTRDGQNYMFRGGEKVAIPYHGQVDIGDVVILAPTNTTFKLKQLANANVSKIVAADFSILQIWDEKAGKCSFYTFWAGGISKSLSPGFLSGTLAGPWNDFAVTKALAVNQFTGRTRFTTGGGGKWSKNYITFMSLPAGAQTFPNPLPFNTGVTIGISAGTSVGNMHLELLGTRDGLLAFNGP